MVQNWKEWLEKEKKKATRNSWDFELFSITCNKCGSKDTEVAGEGELSTGYYNSPEHDGNIIIKCHSCGNAMVLDVSGYFDMQSRFIPREEE